MMQNIQIFYGGPVMSIVICSIVIDFFEIRWLNVELKFD